MSRGTRALIAATTPASSVIRIEWACSLRKHESCSIRSIFIERKNRTIRLQARRATAAWRRARDAEGRRRFELEALLGDYEGNAKPVIRKLVAGGELTADERTDLAIFISFAAMRTPDMVNSVQAMNGNFIAHTAKVMFEDIDQVFERLREDRREEGVSDEELRKQAEWMVDMAQNDKFVVQTDEKWAVQMTVRMAMGAAPYLAGRNWRAVHRDKEKQSFITTDSPVFLGTDAKADFDLWRRLR